MTEFGWAPVPGSAGVFQFLSDSFVLPTGAPHRDAAIAWLTVAGSKEGQDAFKPGQRFHPRLAVMATKLSMMNISNPRWMIGQKMSWLVP